MNGERWLADDLVDPDVYAKGVDEGWTDIELYRLIVRQLQRGFHSGTEADRPMLANRPHLTEHEVGRCPGRGHRARGAHARLRRTRLGGRNPSDSSQTGEADRVRDRQRPRLATRRVPPERGQNRQPGPGREDRGWSAVDR